MSQTLHISNIENHGDFDVNSVSLSVGSAMGAPTAYHNDDSKNSTNSTTKSAIANGTLTVRNTGAQQQNVDTLSHDTPKANDSLAQFFDKQKELDTIEKIGLVKDIAVQIKSIGTKTDRIKAQESLESEKESIIKDAKDEYLALKAEDKKKYDNAEDYANSVYYGKVSDQVTSN